MAARSGLDAARRSVNSPTRAAWRRRLAQWLGVCRLRSATWACWGSASDGGSASRASGQPAVRRSQPAAPPSGSLVLHRGLSVGYRDCPDFTGGAVHGTVGCDVSSSARARPRPAHRPLLPCDCNRVADPIGDITRGQPERLGSGLDWLAHDRRVRRPRQPRSIGCWW
jgi:hypothetical protein